MTGNHLYDSYEVSVRNPNPAGRALETGEKTVGGTCGHEMAEPGGELRIKAAYYQGPTDFSVLPAAPEAS